MALNDIVKVEAEQAPPVMVAQRPWFGRQHVATHWTMWCCLLLACIGSSWFAYQTFLIPQSSSFSPRWSDAQWIQASDGSAPVAYFRYQRAFAFVPDAASLTIAANQTFRIFVNNTFVGSNEADFLQGDTLRPYIYDISYALKGAHQDNVIVIRVANLDQRAPLVRANLHLVAGIMSSDYGTNASWRGTVTSELVYPRNEANGIPWSSDQFDASAWPLALPTTTQPGLSGLTVDPQLYEKPLSTQWLSAGVSHQGYFVHHVAIPAPITHYWIRFAAAGPSNIFVNGYRVINWTGQAPASKKNINGSLSALQNDVKYSKSYMVGMYDIGSYLHTGNNVIAVYVSAPDVTGLLGRTSASMSMDVLLADAAGNTSWDSFLQDWYAAVDHVDGWEYGDATWGAAILIARPVNYQSFYLLDSNAIVQRSTSLANTQSPPIFLVLQVVAGCLAFVFGCWFLSAWLLGRRYYGSWQNSLALMSIAFLPALACEAVLIALAREPGIADPFPYNWIWLCVLLAILLLSYLGLWLHAYLTRKRGWQLLFRFPVNRTGGFMSPFPFVDQFLSMKSQTPVVKPTWQQRLWSWFKLHWSVLPLILYAIPLVFSTLSYEPLWQDELVSYYVAKNSIAHGIPMMPSGFIYAKAELFHYMLGLVMLIFGDQGTFVPRSLSAVEFILSIPVLYAIGSYFFGRRVGWLAAAMLTFSPFTLVWGSQLRMYEQAQLCVLIAFYIFYRAARCPHSRRWPYLAIVWLLITYFSHEETFIILPGLVLGVFMHSMQRGRLLPAVFYNKHWWFAAFIGIAVIGAQLLVVKFSHPPVLGTDQSMRPNIQLNEDGIPFYITLLFFPKPNATWLTLDSWLALLSCLWSIRSKNSRLKYCALFLVLGIFMMACVFTMEADRYFYPLLPIYFLLGAFIVIKALKSVWKFVRTRIALTVDAAPEERKRQRLMQPFRLGALATAALTCVVILLAPMLPISNYSLGLSRVLNLPYYRHFSDYDAAGSYILQHERPGDIIISISPDIEMYYYAHESDYYFSIDRALFLLERNGHIINTSTAAIALLNQHDLDAVLAQHPRVWIVSDHGSYENQVMRRFQLPEDFHIVFEGARNVVYLRGS
ncbi:glycosyltransferase family 39 protein [Tengunoibacter tsumagoiensis]|uniref:Glycosyltransferase RgtA/B/C/D-like domain-containing protein n=1 Tax=Tengunoibacter tsumagoiensis TaxID=2014871 RepID=A0A401ZVH6_9CHLR|nr:glycosyltransferase family 39 protein [Tengunoibacter tsumagoiensis]GCE10909.1 hypothetical protein KTT_07680 [Tengunoibacter tsumagoiensis]